MMNQKGNPSWRPAYWTEDKHGSAWERTKEAFKRDWEQTKADFSKTHGKELNQDVDDTVSQATGLKPIPGPNTPNAEDRKWEEVEPAVAYGYGAHEEYGSVYDQWDDKLENRLAREWDRDRTGKSFDEVKRNVRRGWEYKH
jgi:hypothetical protein